MRPCKKIKKENILEKHVSNHPYDTGEITSRQLTNLPNSKVEPSKHFLLERKHQEPMEHFS